LELNTTVVRLSIATSVVGWMSLKASKPTNDFEIPASERSPAIILPYRIYAGLVISIFISYPSPYNIGYGS
jgi:hypothetical protein